MCVAGDCSLAPSCCPKPMCAPSLLPPSSVRVPRMFRFITINCFMSERWQNGHFGLLLSVYTLQDGQCAQDLKDLEKAGRIRSILKVCHSLTTNK